MPEEKSGTPKSRTAHTHTQRDLASHQGGRSSRQSQRCAVLIGIGSDIGKALSERYLRDGFTVVGTYRTEESLEGLKLRSDIHLFRCDVHDRESVAEFLKGFGRLGLAWDTAVSCVGQQAPIGRFFSLDFEEWAASVEVNSLDQLRIAHGLFPHRSAGASLVFFAGGGTNNPMTDYSAYCAAKILLIKMCELLDDEEKSLNVFIVGPGWVRTKIHEDTMRNPAGAEQNYQRTKAFLDSGNPGTSMDDIYDCIAGLCARGRDVAGGRNFSVVNDAWIGRPGGEALAGELRSDKDMYKLRRHRNSWKPT